MRNSTLLKAFIVYGAAQICLHAEAQVSDPIGAIQRESGYIVDCSWTTLARNHAGLTTSQDAYGLINVNRIATTPDWVEVGESGVAAIGLIAAGERLYLSGQSITSINSVLSTYFNTWIASRQQTFELNSASADYGAAYSRVYYDANGHNTGHDAASAASTAMIITAGYKYYEYLQRTGQSSAAKTWMTTAWPILNRAGQFIIRMINPTYWMVRTNSSNNDLWISDSTYTVGAFRCLDRWERLGKAARLGSYGAKATQISTAISKLKDPGSWHNFYRYRSSSQNYAATYGDRVDNLCYVPIEFEAIADSDPFAASVSNWWTTGDQSGTNMTNLSTGSTYFGTRQQMVFGGSSINSYLYPGSNFQLGKAEWKIYRATGNTSLLARAKSRLTWATSTSGLWVSDSDTSDYGVPNGFVDWRDETNFPNLAPTWARFCDTSANAIELILMISFGQDTTYGPDPSRIP